MWRRTGEGSPNPQPVRCSEFEILRAAKRRSDSLVRPALARNERVPLPVRGRLTGLNLQSRKLRSDWRVRPTFVPAARMRSPYCLQWRMTFCPVGTDFFTASEGVALRHGTPRVSRPVGKRGVHVWDTRRVPLGIEHVPFGHGCSPCQNDHCPSSLSWYLRDSRSVSLLLRTMM